MLVCLLCRVWCLCTNWSHSAQNHSESKHSPQRIMASLTWQCLHVIWTMFSAENKLTVFCGLACCQHCWTSICLWHQLDNGGCWENSCPSMLSESRSRSSCLCILKSSKREKNIKNTNITNPTLHFHCGISIAFNTGTVQRYQRRQGERIVVNGQSNSWPSIFCVGAVCK